MFKQNELPAPQRPEVPYSDREFLHSLTAAVYVPLSQSAVTGVVVFVATLIISWIATYAPMVMLSAILGIITFASMWVALQWRWLTLTNIERMTHLDLNRDGVIGEKPVKKEKAVTVIRFEKVDHGNYSARIVNLPASEEQLRILADGFEHGTPFTDRAYSGSGKPFSIAEFIMLRRAMEKAGLVEQVSEKDPRQGYRLTAEGEEWKNSYLDNSAVNADES